ncbi:ribosome hibernation-promoting factor, HPF/YfiA family [Ferrimonas lipolytica]|uniref:Ribosome-associated translation inhibitor RaiA n=1 Tax=Ferrimonas lipolytica TaxID=2724191 RepID=A0A6H1UA91_9GAMM|nr:ribosome-associated translation inhibitor RaiA [Ferrimonas lipolytica]QIZ75549.1 ribosome-associated translation inhibitor RaiA [Ferrimonas lipolytica]
MRIEITSKSVAVTESMETHIDSCFEKLARHDIDLIGPHIIITQEGKEFQVEATTNSSVGHLFAKANAEDLYAAINQLGQRLERQVNKLVDKATSRRHDRTAAVIDADIA